MLDVKPGLTSVLEPRRFTAPLPGNEGPDGLPILSDGYRLIELVHTFWIVKGEPLRLDEWQQRLLIRILERCPPGHQRAGALRYRQVVVSIPRQAGKSLLAAVLGLYGLLQHQYAPKVLGVADTTHQAGIVYGYARDAIVQSRDLSDLLIANTRGIRFRDPTQLGMYKVLAAKIEKLQGYAATLSIVDELHILVPDIWDALVDSQKAQSDPLLIGITTAGDVTSVLLKRLYAQGDAAIAGDQETFGFFCWESTKDELTLEAIEEANPAVAAGRISAQTIYEDDRVKPPSHWKRYTLNRFVDGLAEPWVPVEAWRACAGKGLEDFKDAYYAIDVTPTYSFATIVAAKVEDGKVKTTLVARLVNPRLTDLQDWAVRLRKAGRCQFVLDVYRNKTLAKFLDDRGYEVVPMGTSGSKTEAAGLVYAAILRHEIEHDNNQLVNVQHAQAKIKTRGEQFVIVPNEHDADAAYASVYAMYAAMTHKRKGLGIS